MEQLETYGWSDKLHQLKQQSPHSSLSHGRVAVVHRTCYEVISENGLLQCELTGNMLYGKPDYELPCVGDWVIFQPFDEGKGIIVDMLPRERTLYRKKSGTVADRQAIASYVDKAFIVQSLDDNFNMRRAERFMVQILEEDISPVLVLNKADLEFDRQKVEEQIQHIARQIPIFYTSIHRPESVSLLREFISEGETVVFVGSSGVGKSSLVNALSEKAVLLTSDISASTGKGRHTSTRREMVLMDGSGVLIDTPGVREFGLTVDNTDSLAEILDISDYAGSCRFKDCTHTNEPGCAVQEAVDNGLLDAKVYESFQKLKREAWHFTTSEHEKRKKEKSFTKLVEGVKKLKGI
ncbi:ribosome small subunit-dependent GTPase A [Prevotella sp. 10(H)]|uniref:ribosome small subunit-dependent GTPase A n=1 Tax=Prevotella sp. 10(H) TaxID=1158294 RepID=UPI0004A747BB|nr:ribosome small subunit-dependent GTPase A [Prevotella sp. 10(H)]